MKNEGPYIVDWLAHHRVVGIDQVLVYTNDCEDGNGLTYWYVLHAEANAMMKVARSTNNARGATLYLTHSPCKECSKLVLQAGIKRLVYMDAYKDPSGLDLLEQGGVLIHRLELP